MITKKKSHRNAQSHVENTLLRIRIPFYTKTIMMTSAEQCLLKRQRNKTV